MTWIKLDDSAVDHPKIAGLSDRAFRSWVRSLSYASRFLTDGALPVPFLVTVPRKVQEEIITAGLWLVVSNGVTIHDYLEHQTSKASVERERRRNRERRTGGTSPGTPTGRTDEKPRPEKIQSREDLPQTPADAGAVRVRREHRSQAKQILKARMGYCPHEVPCVNVRSCEARIASEIARKAS